MAPKILKLSKGTKLLKRMNIYQMTTSFLNTLEFMFDQILQIIKDITDQGHVILLIFKICF